MKSKSKQDKQSDNTESSFREKLLEHAFVSELLQEAWFNRRKIVEVLRSEVDGSGYDLVLECDGIIRHVQLKSSRKDSSTPTQTVNMNLTKKPNGCVIWLLFEENIELHRVKIDYLFFGGYPGKPLHSLDKYSVGRHTKANSKGYKSERPATRVIPKGEFTKIGGIVELMDMLFGTS